MDNTNRSEEYTPLLRESSINSDTNQLNVESKGCMSSPLCHPNYALHRYYVLVFMCFLGFGKTLVKVSLK
jgi:hypothetical protein